MQSHAIIGEDATMLKFFGLIKLTYAFCSILVGLHPQLWLQTKLLQLGSNVAAATPHFPPYSTEVLSLVRQGPLV